MAMFLRACERCGGDMQVGSDVYGSYEKCVQCGHMVDSETVHALALMDEAAPLSVKTKKTTKVEAA